MLGLGLSKWNGEWDATKAKSSGVDFVLIQASSSDAADPQFSANWLRAKGASLFRGAYHNLDVSVPVEKQLACLIQSLDGDPGELPCAVKLDLNRIENSPELAFASLHEFLEGLKKVGKRSILSVQVGSKIDWNGFTADWSEHLLWISDFDPSGEPQAPAAWPDWTFCSFSEKGEGDSFGTESFDVELIDYRGELGEMLALLANSPQSTLVERIVQLEHRVDHIDQFVACLQAPTTHHDSVAQEEGHSVWPVAVCHANSLNVRSGPGFSHPVVGTLTYNQGVRIRERRADWVQIIEPQGWISARYIAIESDEPKSMETQ